MKKILIMYIVFSFVSAFSQNKIELLNQGNEHYQNEEFDNAEFYYKKALEKDNAYFKGNLNTGHSLFKQAVSLIQNQDTTSAIKLEDAEKFYKNCVELSENKNEKAESYYNTGNAQLLSGKIDECIESYKNSLRLVPENMQTKHNLALAQSIKNKREENKEENQEKEKKKENQEEEKKKENQEEEKKEDLSKEEIEQILNALEREEKEVQEDMQKKKGIGKGKLLKDW